ncbi:MAG: hypothetical protein ACFCVE_13135 [Phycisphaerae bacterium]
MTSKAKSVLDEQFLEMRWRLLSLAADFDRIQRAGDGALPDDPRIAALRHAAALLQDDAPGRAERLQMLLSDG